MWYGNELEELVRKKREEGLTCDNTQCPLYEKTTHCYSTHFRDCEEYETYKQQDLNSEKNE